MTQGLIVTGTDTGVGKTVVAAALAGALDAAYWKPIQCGLENGGDSAEVRTLSGLPAERLLPEAYRFAMAASPHRAAEAEGIEISLADLTLPDVRGPLVVEGAGGLMVPLTRQSLLIDLFASWRLPVVLVARTALGTINHSLLSIEALNGRNIPILGVAFVGDEVPDTERTIVEMGGVRRLGRLPHIAPLTRASLAAAFAENFRIEDLR
ncbi:dithiobiotin synthetase [Hyphomicrobium nitrativorans NL23]|uniref:ATP-dependent dethiobiotin synthetase BioD n=1 Tax=Hyphomicrobium nitrativorans NL23 TaxID=1029756 RepID=V5SD18_9HYPH|nr:dethiobiotin synthase [Hyphomicrobium nitrativorans]AHB47955.1 dithiobiotin synthetase [Hyphomicrobium nitrativorans NL23]